MRIRPVDGGGDMLPILTSAAIVSGAPAVALLVEDRLKLLAGDWWENPSWGCQILAMLQSSRLTEADGQSLSVYLSGYVRETPDVKDVQNEAFEFFGRQFRWSCTIITEYGSASINYQTNT